MPNSIYMYILPYVCWESPERAWRIKIIDNQNHNKLEKSLIKK